MNQLQVTGKQIFMEAEIPIVLGGFGEGKKCMSDKTIAEIHSMNAFDVRRRISDNIKRFAENVDFIDLKQRMHETQTLNLLSDLGYAKQSITQAEHIYILSERGYAKLIKIMDSDLAWEIHDKLIDEYFHFREAISNLSGLSPQLQLLINMEIRQNQLEDRFKATDAKVDSIRDIVALNPNDWRKDSANLISKMAYAAGGTEHIRPIYNEIYELLDARMKVNVKRRLTNKRQRMADEGVSKSKRDALTVLDVIADDKKLIEGYIAIVKEMAVKHGIAA